MIECLRTIECSVKFAMIVFANMRPYSHARSHAAMHATMRPCSHACNHAAMRMRPCMQPCGQCENGILFEMKRVLSSHDVTLW